MGKYLSIGQMGKLNNLSVQTLRHYEKVGILNPSYINEETGYRYYSMKDFNTIDLIKQCKALGLSLEEIKEANTKDKVFLIANIKLVDAMEEISLEINL